MFSYRFEASSAGQLFAPGKAKEAFWTHTVDAFRNHRNRWLLTTDISDYYSQIRHSLLEAELDAAIPEHAKVVMSAVRAVQGHSEIGIPVGPHSAHLLSELLMASFDDYMIDQGYELFRFVDDIHVACATESAAREALYDIADYLHSHLNLSLSRHKTQVLNEEGMRGYGRTALGTSEDGEDGHRLRIDELIDKHTSANDDDAVDLAELDEESRASLDPDRLEHTLEVLLDGESQIRLRKYLRVLSHLQAPGAVEWVSTNLSSMLPALPQAITYLLAALPVYGGDRARVVEDLLKAMDLPIVAKSEHMQMLILAICVQFPEDVDFTVVSRMYKRVRPAAQREIILLAGKLDRRAWLKAAVLRHGITDPWLLSALVEASRCLGAEERRSLKAQAHQVLGSHRPLANLRRNDSLSPATYLPADILLAASKQDAMLRFSHSGDVGMWQQFAAKYKGAFKSANGLSLTFSGLDLGQLLADAEGGHLEGQRGAADLLEVLSADGECLYERLPGVTLGAPAELDVDDQMLARLLVRSDVLIITSAEIERRTVLSRMAPLKGKKTLLVGSRGSVTYRIGQFGRYAAAHVHTTQGPDGRLGATLTVAQALEGIDFKACLIIGIAFGFDRKSQRLGDVLVAETVQPYEHAKVEGDDQSYKSRGQAMPCGTVLSERFRNRMMDWTRHRSVTRVALQQGTVLSGAKLVNSKPFRDRLLHLFGDLKPIGGEMEGHAAYAAAQHGSTEIVLVKGICDWADGDKNDRAQSFAMEMAVDACHHLLSKPNVLGPLNAKDLKLPAPVPRELPDVSTVLEPPRPRAPWLSDDLDFGDVDVDDDDDDEL